MSGTLGVGIIGCGNISTTYFERTPLFRGLELRACADVQGAAATAQGAKYGVPAMTAEALLADPAVDVVVNLTIPDAHFAVSRAALSAGKHVYSEKPLALTLEDGLALRDLAAAKGLRAGCAPDTFLGGAHQQARALVDAGTIGAITAASCHVMSHGMESWHPNPDFFFLPGAGPVLDIGPYYVAALINLIGPVRRVVSLATSATPTRTISSQPRAGEEIPVKTPTNIHALLDFEGGATVTLSASWDVWAHRHGNMEIYGTEGSMFPPDPNFFGGPVGLSGRDGAIADAPDPAHPFGIPNQQHKQGMMANYRGAGLADMAAAMREGRDHRCSLDRALHALDVMTGILQSGEDGAFVAMRTTCARPAALGADEAAALLA